MVWGLKGGDADWLAGYKVSAYSMHYSMHTERNNDK